MSAPYIGNPALPAQGSLTITIPTDGDPDNAASVNQAFQPTADFSEMIYEQLQAAIASSWVKQTSAVATIMRSVAAIPAGASAPTFPNFIAVGDTAVAPPAIQTSPDGITWTSRTGVGTTIQAIAAGINNVGTLALVASIGASGQNLQTSPDGITWTLRTSGVTFTANGGGIAYSPSLALWCVVGGGPGAGGAITSPDGITWTSRTVGAATDQLTSVTWAPSLALFIACGYGTVSNAPEIFTSPDGITWTSRTVPTPGTINAQCVVWSPTASLAMMIASSSLGASGQTWTSPDGINWTLRGALPGAGQGGVLAPGGPQAVHTGRQWLVAAGQSLGRAPLVYSSIDNGVTWKARRESGVATGTYNACSICIGPLGTMVIGGTTSIPIWTGFSSPLT